ncbi:MAG: STAS domain-containing protein [Actinobacteria bacterium]|nr:STAS domain-containing protein [Actinomycetota bacterium]
MTDFAIWGPIARGDLPGLSDRVCALLRGSGGEVACCDVTGIAPDAVTVDALARLQLAAARLGCQVRLRNASAELQQLVALMGLSDVLSDHTHQGGRMATNRKLFVNIPVADLDRAVEFFTTLGFSFDPRFTDETATCMLVGEDAYFMLITTAKFADFAKKDLADPKAQTAAMFALTAETREEVDSFIDIALGAGGTLAAEPMDLGFMVGRSFYDLDGHHWEIFWLDPSAKEQ